MEDRKEKGKGEERKGVMREQKEEERKSEKKRGSNGEKEGREEGREVETIVRRIKEN